MERVITITELPGRDALFQRFCLRGGSVFIGAANVQRLVAGKAAIARENIGGEHLNEIPEVRNIVHVGKG